MKRSALTRQGPIEQEPTQAGSAAIVKTAGLRSDAPRDVVNAIVKAVDARDGSDAKEVALALSNFNLPELLVPGATVDTLATGIAALAQSGDLAKVAQKCP